MSVLRIVDGEIARKARRPKRMTKGHAPVHSRSGKLVHPSFADSESASSAAYPASDARYRRGMNPPG